MLPHIISDIGLISWDNIYVSKASKSTLKRKLDKAVGEWCRSIGYCERCGKTEKLQWCHVSSRRYLVTRWDPDNFVCMCVTCHFWQHDNPTMWTEWFNKKYPGRMQRLHKKLQSGKTMGVKELETIYENLVRPS